MTFALIPARPFPKEVRRLADRQLARAIEVLDRQPDGAMEAIHAARKAVKKVRGLYRFIAKADPAASKAESRRLGDAARGVSRLRDAQVMVETARLLRDRLADEEREAAERAIDALESRRNWILEAEADLDGRLGDFAEALARARQGTAQLTLEGGAKAAARTVTAAWARCLKRAHRALQAARADRTPEAFHTLRKRSQDYRFNHLLLTRLWPGAFAAREREIKVLVENLGLLNDFNVLARTLDEEPQLLSPEDLLVLRHALEVEIGADGRRALEEAARLYAEPPKAEARRIAALWTAAL